MNLWTFPVLVLCMTLGEIESAAKQNGNFLRVALGGLENSNPSENRRSVAVEFHSVYDKGPVVPGEGRHFFVSEDYMVFDGVRNRVIEFFDPEPLINCACELPFPPELDIPYRFAVYNPVTVQAPLPDVPKDLYQVKYTGFYYACPVHSNPYEFAWYQNRQNLNPCKWMWYQSVNDSAPGAPVK